MSRNYVAMPTIRPRNAMIDFSPVASALDSWRDQTNTNTRNAMMRDQMAQQKEQQDWQRGRAEKQDALAATDRRKTMLGNLARMVDMEQDPVRRKAMWEQVIKTHGADGLDAGELDPMTGPRMAMAQAGVVVDPLDRDIKRAGLALTRAQIASAGQKSATPQDRAMLAEQYGLQPGTPQYQSYVLTGQLAKERAPNLMNPTVQKELFEAEDMVSNNASVLSTLQQAKKLSPNAYGGLAASARGVVGSQFGLDSANKTRELENLITQNALSSLRAVFGGNPTEGERRILLDVAGSVGETDAVRQTIYDRAIEAANKRLADNQRKAQALRTGEYFSPDYDPYAGPTGGQSGPRPGDVMDGYRFKGGNPASPASWEKL